MTMVPTITVWQPWASLIAIGAKPFEFRTRPPPARHVGRRIAIHAATRRVRYREYAELFHRLTHEERSGPTQGGTSGLVLNLAWKVLVPEYDDEWNGHDSCVDWLPYGAIVCTAILGSSLCGADLDRALGVRQSDEVEEVCMDGDEAPVWGWPLTDVRPLDPVVPARGKQGWWFCDLPEGARP